MLSLKPGENTVLSFSIGEGDIGGTLAVELALILSRVSNIMINYRYRGTLVVELALILSRVSNILIN